MKHHLARLFRALNLSKRIQLALMRATQDEFLIGATAIVLNEKNQILLAKHSYRQTQWSLPGGYIKAKEHPHEGLEREIEEETGLIVNIEDTLKVRTDRESARIDITCVGKYIGGEFKKSTEVQEVKFFSFKELPRISKSQLLFINQVLEEKNQKKES